MPEVFSGIFSLICRMMAPASGGIQIFCFELRLKYRLPASIRG
jgi:hypothetical protein